MGTLKKRPFNPWWIVGVGCYGLAAAVGYQYYQGWKESSWIVTDEDRFKAFALRAPHYDEDVDRDEKLYKVTERRKELIERAKGKVLEVGAGTGRNLPYYRWKDLKSVVLTDYSEEMLLPAKKKALALERKYFVYHYFLIGIDL